MQSLDYIKLIFDYHYWANRKLWVSVMRLSKQDFKRDIDYSLGSVHRHMVHMLWAEALWFRRIHGESRVEWTVNTHPTCEGIIAQWHEIEADYKAYFENLTLNELDREISVYSKFADQTYIHTVNEILLHIVNHGTDHRAQILRMIGDFGGQTFPQDMAYYFRELRANQGK